MRKIDPNLSISQVDAGKSDHKDLARPLHYMLLRSRYVPLRAVSEVLFWGKRRASWVSEPMPMLNCKFRSVRVEFCSRASAKAWHGDKWLQKQVSGRKPDQTIRRFMTGGSSMMRYPHPFFLRIWIADFNHQAFTEDLWSLWCEW